MNIKIRIISSNEELKSAFLIRRKVFIFEQNVPENIELDNFDKNSTHILAYHKKKPIGTARWRRTNKGIKLERFAILKNYRYLHIGTSLVYFILNELKGEECIYLHAQEQVMTFYEKFNFEKTGTKFIEAGIKHWCMILK